MPVHDPTDLSGVIEAETELIEALPADGLAIVNGDDAALLEVVQRKAACRIISFGEKETNQLRTTDVQVSRHGDCDTSQEPGVGDSHHLITHTKGKLSSSPLSPYVKYQSLQFSILSTFKCTSESTAVSF